MRMLHLVGCVINFYHRVRRVSMKINQMNMLFNVDYMCKVNCKCPGINTLCSVSRNFPSIRAEQLNTITTNVMKNT